MTINYINIGSSPNKGDGDTLRTAFKKINENFAFLSTSSGFYSTGSSTVLNISPTAPSTADGTLWFNTQDARTYVRYSGAWVDASPQISPPPTTGTEAVITVGPLPPSTGEGSLWFNENDARTYINYGGAWIDSSPQVTPPPTLPADSVGVLANDGHGNLYWTTATISTATVDFLSVPSSIIPSTNLTYDLGSPTKQWRSLYVGTSTIYIGGVPISISQSNTLVVGTGTQAVNVASEDYVTTQISQIPVTQSFIGTGNFSVSSSDTFNFVIAGTDIANSTVVNNYRIHGSVGGLGVGITDPEYITITTGAEPISALYLTKYVSVDNRGFFAIQEGPQWTIPQNRITPEMLAYGHFGRSGIIVGSNALDGFEALQPNTTYTIWVQQIGTAVTEYVFSTNPLDTGGISPLFYSPNPLQPTVVNPTITVVGGELDPSLALKRGHKYTFNINTPNHTFWILTTSTYNPVNVYPHGITNNGTGSGILSFVVPGDAPDSLYYMCPDHPAMAGVINIRNASATDVSELTDTQNLLTSEVDIYKFQYGVIGTKDTPDTGNWGGYPIVLDPGGESYAGMYIPSVDQQTNGGSLNIYNNQVAGNSIQLSVHAGSFTFGGDGKLTFPAGYSLPGNTGTPGQVLVLNEDNTVTWQNQVGDADPNIWVERFESATPQNNRPQIANSVEYDSQGNIYALVTVIDINSNTDYAAVSKLDTNGVSLWHARFVVGNTTDGWGLAVDNAGGFVYIAGRFNDGTYDKSTLTKLSTLDGTAIWSTTYDFGYASNSPVVDVDSEGNPVVVGYSYNNNSTGDQVTVTKINKTDGSIIWAKALDGQGNEQAYGMAVGPMGEVVAIGYMSQLGETGDTEDRMLVAKYDIVGALQWQKAVLFDTGYDCSGADADIDSAGNIYVCGQYYNADINQTCMSLVKFDGNGVKQWSRRVVGNCQTLGTSIVVGPDDFLYLSGITGNNNTADFTWVVAKYSELGNVVWQRLLDNTAGWSLPGGNFFSNGGGSGSNIAVKNGYFVVSGAQMAFADSNSSRAIVAQFDTAGTPVVLGNWDFKPASFSGLLNSGATDIAVVDAVKTSTDISTSTTATTITPGFDISNFLIGQVINGNTVNTGDITFAGVQIQGSNTANSNGSIELVPNPNLKGDGRYLNIYPTTLFDYPRIHIAAGANGELVLGDDSTYFSVGNDGVLKINNSGGQWRFGTDGKLTFPNQPTNNRTGSAEALVFAKSNNQKSIATANGTDGSPYVERLVIAGGDSYRDPNTGVFAPYSEGGDLYLWAGRGANGGDIKVDAGNSQGVDSEEGGTIKIRGGSSQSGQGGFVHIEAGSGVTNGLVRITTPGHNWDFNTDGSTTLPGAVIKSTVDKTFIANYGNATALTDAGGWTDIVNGTYGPFTLSGVEFTVDVLDNTTTYLVVAYNQNHYVNDTIGSLSAADLGGSVAHTSNVSVTSVNTFPIALDLTKSINKLADGNYTLANGVEGQIMYLVQQNGSTPSSINVGISNYRFDGTAQTGGLLFPFRIYNEDASAYFDSRGFCTLIFTDGAWQQSGGSWD